jgi:hypothetical protein
MRIAVIIAALSIFAAAPAAAQKTGTGNDYYEACSINEINFKIAYEKGMCIGVIKTIIYFGEYMPDGYKICSPDNSTTGQHFDVVAAYLKSNPNQRHKDFRALALEALHAAWPCKE